MIKAVIFDLDGLLVDSQHLQYKATNIAFSEKGYPITKEDWYHYWIHEGMHFIKWIEMNRLPLKVEEIRSRKREIYENLIKTELELKPGARNLIDLLYGKFKLVVASSSRIESVELCINKFNLKSKFEDLISDFTLNKPKPHPEVFLHVAKIIKIKPEECLVLEDSLAGLQAAKSAGMKCIICPDNTFFNTSHDLYKKADKIVNSLDEVNLEMINELK